MNNPVKLVKIEGFFLDFTDEELIDIKERLREEGYSPDPAGIKELIIDVLFGAPEIEESGTERLIRKASSFIAENPDTVKAGINTAVNILRMVKRK